MQNKIRFGAAMIAIGLIASGCGPEPESKESTTSSTEPTSNSAGGSGIAAEDEEFCAAEAELGVAVQQLDLQTQSAEVAALISDFATKAPDELKEDLALVASSYTSRDAETGGSTLTEAEMAEVEAAGTRVQDFIRERCQPATTETTVDAAAGAATLVAPAPGATLTGDTPCPATDGSSERTTTFVKAPPVCIDATKAYTAVFETSMGTFEVGLDAKAAPVGVNNLVVLARYHFYDGVPFHRIVPDFVIQGGDPLGEPWGTHGPGYTISEEPPADGTYEKYDFAMAKTSEPNSTGSQFFVVTGSPDPLNAQPTYSWLGKVTAGMDVVDAIGAVPGTGPSGDTPTEAVVMKTVTIKEA